jgi:hypothetical protein
VTGPFGAIVGQARQWAEQAHAAGWLEEPDRARFTTVEQRTPADLFVSEPTRPLVVAFFGGTGVGKSSLLNRLAGTAIARTGPERPTSRQVTVYVHQSVELADLPADLPLTGQGPVKGLPVQPGYIKRHASDAHREVLWIDAPDIDSTEESNRRSALAWLPHVDLVCYVVSPERYRDDAGWRVLRQRGHKHGWMFVLNRWDEGDPRQVEDLARLLRQAGFDDPLVLTTCCLPGRPLPSPDQFDRLQAALFELLEAHGVRELTRLGHRARLQELRAALQAAQKHLGDQAAWQRLAEVVRQRWHAAAGTIRQGAEWSMLSGAAWFAAREGGVLEQARRRLLPVRSQASEHGPAQQDNEHRSAQGRLDELISQLWDDWAQSKLVACLDAIELVACRTGLPAAPIRRQTEALAGRAGSLVRQQLRDSVRAALSCPGTALRRLARRGTGFLMSFLPVAAVMWVAWAVVRGYRAASGGQVPFLGVEFAIHSGLLVAVAWAVPFTLDRLLRPSLGRTLLRALRAGLEAGLDEVGKELAGAVDESAAGAQARREQAGKLLLQATGLLVKPIDLRVPALARLVARPPGGNDVRDAV